MNSVSLKISRKEMPRGQEGQKTLSDLPFDFDWQHWEEGSLNAYVTLRQAGCLSHGKTGCLPHGSFISRKGNRFARDDDIIHIERHGPGSIRMGGDPDLDGVDDRAGDRKCWSNGIDEEIVVLPDPHRS